MNDLAADRTIEELEKLKSVWLRRLERCRASAAEIAQQEHALLGTIRRVQEEIDRRDKDVAKPSIDTWRDVVGEVIEAAPRGTPDRDIARTVEALCIEEGIAAPSLATISVLVRRLRRYG